MRRGEERGGENRPGGERGSGGRTAEVVLVNHQSWQGTLARDMSEGSRIQRYRLIALGFVHAVRADAHGVTKRAQAAAGRWTRTVR